MGGIRLWFVRLLLRDELSKIEGEIDQEFRFHLDMKAAALMARGMEPDEARAAAIRSFGDAGRLRSSGALSLSAVRRKERRVHRFDWLVQDVRDGFRRLTRRPGFTLLAGGTLALGLSTSTAVFTYVDAYRRPFPGADAGDLHQVYLNTDAAPFGALSWPDYQDLEAATDGAFEMAGVGLPLFAASVRHEDLTEVVFGQGVTGNWFSVLRVPMSAGRGLSAEDDRPGAPPAVVISHGYWVRRYGSDPGVLGRTILLNAQPHTIVGVAGPDFLGSSAAFRPQIWLPFEQFMRVYWARTDTKTDRAAGAVTPYVRMVGDMTPARARGTLDALATGLDREVPLAVGTRRFVLRPATWISPTTREAEASGNRIIVLAAAFLLLLACANVANLVLAAGARRQPELSVRSALGATRGRLVRQLLAEHLILSTLAGGLALAAAGPLGSRLSSYFARPSVWGANVPREIAVDPGVVLFALAVAIATGVLTGLVPALRASNRDPASAMGSGDRWTSAGRRPWPAVIPGMREALVAAQIALCVVLLFLAGLVVRTLESARDVDAGFNTSSTLASYISTSSMGVPAGERYHFFQDLVRRFEELPWVQAATVAENAPLSAHPSIDLRIDGVAQPVRVTVARVFPGYFEAMEMEVVSGRSLLQRDTAAAAGVVLINEALAQRMAPDGDAAGRRVWLPGGNSEPDRGFSVVGVVRNARQTSLLDEPEPVAYFSLPQHFSAPGNALLLNVTGRPAASVDRMEQELHAVDPRIAIVNILPYSDVVSGFLYTQRMNAELFTVIATLGLILAAAGIFSVVALAVARKQREIGIRMAIGADRTSIVGLVVASILGPVGLGLILGLIGALLASTLVDSLTWGVATVDLVSLATGLAVLLGAISLAVALPVLRATHIDPVGSLRTD